MNFQLFDITTHCMTYIKWLCYWSSWGSGRGWCWGHWSWRSRRTENHHRYTCGSLQTLGISSGRFVLVKNPNKTFWDIIFCIILAHHTSTTNHKFRIYQFFHDFKLTAPLQNLSWNRICCKTVLSGFDPKHFWTCIMMLLAIFGVIFEHFGGQFWCGFWGRFCIFFLKGRSFRLRSR